MTGQGEAMVVQIAPNDHPPFADICATYRAALDSLGCRHTTIMLAPPFAEPDPDATYLDIGNLGSVRRAGRTLAGALPSKPLVAICHRYRAYRVLRASGVKIPRVVAVAHEFGFFKRRQRRLERRLFARSVLFAGVSPAVQAELGAEVDDPLCLPNALDVAALDRDRLERDQALDVLGVEDSDSLTIGIVGRLVRKKAPKLALDTLRLLVTEQNRDVRLLVIGDGPMADELRAQAAGIPVVFCGFVPHARRLFTALDLLLLTSEEVEAFGMVALEAMCAGVPVVAGPAPGPQFVLGSSGYYYTRRQPDDVAEAVLRLERDRQTGQLDARLEHARARAVREFSVGALARHLDDLFFRGAR
ncbi:MAG: glycosyltransferase [Pseudomonadales bacterium]|jgi:glycosyltransferase involved in cell wall biosynthesis